MSSRETAVTMCVELRAPDNCGTVKSPDGYKFVERDQSPQLSLHRHFVCGIGHWLEPPSLRL